MKLCNRNRSAPALAGGPRFRGHTNTYHEEFCYRYTEEYVPGYYNKHGRYVGGYVKSRKKKSSLLEYQPTIISRSI